MKSRFLEKVNKFDKLAELTKKMTLITNIRNERGNHYRQCKY